MTVYDCCMVYNEIDMLDLRMHILRDVVDYHVIVESGMTHSGLQKPDYIGQAIMDGRFDEFSDKIIYAYTHELEGDNSWARERWQRDYIGKILRYNAAPEDYVLVCDADEIPHPDAIKKVVQQGAPVANLPMRLYYYDFAHRVHEGWSAGMCQWGVCQDANKIRRGEFGVQAREVKPDGWHASYFFTPEGVVDKLNAFMHHDDVARDVPRDPAWIADKMRKGQDLFGRTIQIEHVSPNGNLPAYVCDNIDKYRTMGWVE